MKNKKAEILMENVVFILVAVAFFAMMFLFINLKSNSVYSIEEVNAKKIALIIDAAESDTKIIVDVNEVFSKNKLLGANPIVIDSENNFVRVKMSEKSGYNYGFYNKKAVSSEFTEQEGRKYLILIIG